MDPELDKRLAAIEKNIEENTTILKGLRRHQRMAVFMKLFYWALLLGLGIVAASFIKPYLKDLGSVYGVGDSTKSDYSELLNSI